MNIMSWNIKQFNYNPQKDENEQIARIYQIAEIVSSRDIDILAVLEVRPSIKSPLFGESYDNSQGALAITQLKEILGGQWRYALSGGNAYKESNKGELYAFLWRSDRVTPLNEPSLINTDAQQKILPFKNRVPAMMLFGENNSKQVFAIMVYHAPNPSEMSSKEIGYIKKLAHIQEFPTVLCGDFNMDTKNVSTILQPEFNLAVTNETSLRVKPTGTDNPYDAIFYHGLTLQSAGGDNLLVTIENTLNMNITTAQEIKSIKHYTSDHAPVWAQFSLT